MYFFPVFRPLDDLKFRSTIPADIFKNGHSDFHFKDSSSSFSSTEFPEKCQEGISFSDALATNIGDTFLYGKRKELRGEAGKARDARAA
jgi:hypothetical protein